jgi:hypothetical protein
MVDVLADLQAHPEAWKDHDPEGAHRGRIVSAGAPHEEAG